MPIVKKSDNIEELFKETFDNFEVDPGDQLWANIKSDLPVDPASSA